MARTKKLRTICAAPRFCRFSPTDSDHPETVWLTFDEYEVLRLHDLEHFTHASVARQMQVSRPTVSEMLSRAHEKIADALTNGKQIALKNGGCMICKIGMNCPKASEENCSKKHRCGAFCRYGTPPEA